VRRTMIKAEDRAKALAKVKKLAGIATQLRRGRDFPITRLTMLKSLCQDPVAAARFGLYLTKLTRAKAKKRYRPLVDRAVAEATRYLSKPTGRPPERLRELLGELFHSQNEVEHHRWADVRIIHCREALLAEYMLSCITQPWASAYWGYRLAAFYAERYDSRYGTGLIPASAAAVEDIVRFWTRYLRTQGAVQGSGRARPKRSPRS